MQSDETTSGDLLGAKVIEYTEQELIEIFDERASIREYDGGMARSDAEKAAYFDWRKIVGREVKVPEYIRKLAEKFRG